MNQLAFSDMECSNRKKKTKRQIWLNLSDEEIEDSIYDSYAMRSFMHIDFHEQQVSDTTILLKFRHMLESNKLGEKLYADVNSRLDKVGLMMHGVTEAANLIREDDEVVYGDSGYLGAVSQPAIKDAEKKFRMEFRINKRPSSFKMAEDFKGLNLDEKREHEKSAVRCKVEHPFLIVKKPYHV